MQKKLSNNIQRLQVAQKHLETLQRCVDSFNEGINVQLEDNDFQIAHLMSLLDNVERRTTNLNALKIKIDEAMKKSNISYVSPLIFQSIWLADHSFLKRRSSGQRQLTSQEKTKHNATPVHQAPTAPFTAAYGARGAVGRRRTPPVNFKLILSHYNMNRIL